LILASFLSFQLSINDYVSMPQPSTPRWSPDGKQVAYVLTHADLERSAYDSDVWVVDADGKHDRQLTSWRGGDFRPRWSPDGKRIAFLSDRDGRNAIWTIAPDGGEAQKLVDAPTAIVDFEWSPDGKSIAFRRADAMTADEEKRAKEKDDARVAGEGRKYTHLYLVDVVDAKTRQLTKGDFSVLSFSWSPDSATIAFDRAAGIGLDDLYRSDIYTLDVQSAAMRPLVVRPGLDHAPMYSADGKWLAFTTTNGKHDWVLEHEIHVMPPNGGAERNVSRGYDRTPDTIAWDGDTLWVEGPYNTTTQLYRVNADGTQWTDTTQVQGVIGDPHVQRGRAVYVYQSLTEPPELFIGKTQLTFHNSLYRGYAMLCETRLIRWKNPKDGLEIEGLLTLPSGFHGERVPLLTFVHGGPANRFDQSYLGYLGHIYAPQVLAANGYAVLRPNPRGTGGYGLAFRAANRNDWGGMDWLDINAGIDKLIADGIADPDRLGMMGWSYGGFMSAWAIGHSDRFKAISVGAAVTDLVSYHGTTDVRDFLPHYFDERDTPDTSLDELRHAPLSLDLLRAHSPLWHLQKTKAKVLILHGEADERVPLSQGTMLYRYLDELGVDVKMVTYPRGTHGVREPKMRLDLMRRNVAFFQDAIPVATIQEPSVP
jgi:dipeptidyl aminopeptidase/acylaminoacyl peptidase